MSFFRGAYRALEPGGLLLFDFMSSSRGRVYPSKSRRGADWSITMKSSAVSRGRVLLRELLIAREVNGAVRRTGETHRVCLYSRSRMTEMLRAAGFAVRMRRTVGRVRLMAGDLLAIATPRQA
jgi:hypothetical protein